MAIQPGRVINHFDVKIEEENATLGRESVKYKEEKFKFMQTFFAEQVSALKVSRKLKETFVMKNEFRTNLHMMV